jgi:hypothetical protein
MILITFGSHIFINLLIELYDITCELRVSVTCRYKRLQAQDKPEVLAIFNKLAAPGTRWLETGWKIDEE